jgi:hypothetical protein
MFLLWVSLGQEGRTVANATGVPQGTQQRLDAIARYVNVCTAKNKNHPQVVIALLFV